MGKLWVMAALGMMLATAGPAMGATVNVDPEPVHGTVVDAEGQINCGDGGNDCTGTYAGTTTEPGSANLEAIASTGYTFTGWSGACESFNPDPACSLFFTSNVTRTVSASFADQTPPQVALGNPPQDAVYGPGQSVPLSASASDTTGVISRVDFILTRPGSTSLTVSDSSAPYGGSVSTNGLAEGVWTVVARAYDGANNMAESAARSFTVDKTAPTLSVTGPGEFTATKPQITGFTAGGDTVERRCFVDGGPAVACTSSSSHQTEFDSGQHTVGVQVRDAAGNWSTVQSATFTVDRTAPDATITSPAEGLLTNAGSLIVAFSGDGTGSAIASAQCRLDGGEFVTCDSLTGHTFASAAEGQRTMTVRLFDQAGNSRDATRSVTVDRTGPTVAITGPSEGSTVSADPVVVSFSSTDANGIASHMCSYEGGTAVACTGDGTHTVAGLAEGSRTFTLTVADRAGNVTTVTRSFQVSRPSGGGTTPTEPGGTGGDGSPADPVAVTAIVQSEWTYSRRYTRMLRLRVTGVPPGAAVRVGCKGRGCPFKRRAVKVRGPKVNLISLLRKRKLRVGAVVEIRVTRTGMIGKVVRIKVRRAKRPAITLRCLPPGVSKPTRC